MSDLETDDIGVLIEALQAWVDKDGLGDIMVALMSKTLGPIPESAQVAENQRKEERADAKTWRKETAIILQAKLLSIRNRLAVAHLTKTV
ncbi:MAG: hypothetical protein V3W51_04690 [Candidatus Brocadiales bacterium]